MVASVRGFTPNYQFKLINFDTPRWHTLEYANWQQLDALLLSSGIPGVRGEWTNNTEYNEGDRVFDPIDGLIYRAIVEHTSSATGTFEQERTLNPGYWTLQSMAVPFYRGAWVDDTVYYVGDIVYFGAYTYYLCTINHTSPAAFTPAPNWQVIFDTQATVDTVEDYKDAAETAATNAANSASQAALSEGNSASSAGASATSASAAAASAASASGSATGAANSATNAATSEANAAGSATTASTAATTAVNKATEAAASASSAATSEANADGSEAGAAASAASASTSATTATTQAGIATTKAAEASTSATGAASSASNALSSQNAAASSATAANTDATNAAASAVAAANAAAALRGTSTTSNSIGLGSRTFTTQAGKQFIAGHFAVIANTADPTKWMMCQITSYSGTTLIVNSIGMSAVGGTFADWQIGVSGQPGQAASTVAIVSVGDTAPVSPVDNQLWWETDSGEMFLRYNDGTSTQWVGIIGTQGPAGGGGGSGSPGGADTQIQYNDGGLFNGDASFTFNKATKIITSTGNIRINSIFQAQLQLDTSAAANAYSAVLFNQSGNTKFAIGSYSGSGPWLTFSIDTYDEANNYVASPFNIVRTTAGVGKVVLDAPTYIDDAHSHTFVAAAGTGGQGISVQRGNHTTAVDRWWIQLSRAVDEVGANAGSDIKIHAFSDAGAALRGSVPDFAITRSTGLVTIGYRLQVTGNQINGGNGNSWLETGTTYSVLRDGSGTEAGAIWVGSTGDPANYYVNDLHSFEKRDGIGYLLRLGTTLADFDVPIIHNKRILDPVIALTDAASVALDAATGNAFRLLAAGNRTVAVPTNKPAAGQTQKIIIAHEASGADRTLALTTGSAGSFRFGTDITALTATTNGLVDYIGCVYNANDDRWDVVSYSKGY